MPADPVDVAALSTRNETDEPVDDREAAIYWCGRWADAASALVDAEADLEATRAQLAATRSALEDAVDWAVDACEQGTGAKFGTRGWHMSMSTWEYADNAIPRWRAVLDALAPAPPTPTEAAL